MRRTLLRTFTAALLTAAFARADVYSDGDLTVDLTRAGDDLTGTFTLAGQQYPAKAHVGVNDQIAGTFQAGPNAFDFTAAMASEKLVIMTGGKTYSLTRKGVPANPLAAAGAAPAATPGAAPAGLPAGYTVANKTDAGLAVTATKPPAANVADALSAVLPDIGKLLDGKATVASAVEDQQSHAAGFANFTGSKNGKPVRGVASCQLDREHARIKIVYCDTAAPPEEWQKLNAEQNAVTDAAAKVPTHAYRMPDGTGTLGLPEGWTTKATSFLDPILVEGPNDAKLNINASIIVNTPNGMLMQIYNRGVQMSRQYNLPAPPPPVGLFIDFMSPSDAIKPLVEQMNKFCRAHNLPTTESDKIISVVPTQAQMPNGKAQLIEDTAYYVKPDGTRTLMHGVGRYESAMLGGNDAWMIQMTSMVAPDAQFAQMQPAMLAILNSGKVDQARCDQLGRQRAEQQQQQLAQTAENNRANLDAQFKAGQAAHKQQTASYDSYNHNWAVNENLKSRSTDNFIEYLGGTRDVLDTTTGTRRTYDLNDADAVASGLNDAAADPNRFKAIPLRDDKDPLPQR